MSCLNLLITLKNPSLQNIDILLVLNDQIKTRGPFFRAHRRSLSFLIVVTVK